MANHRSADPRTIITADAFTVAPELLGLPLASPWRRAAAMLLDLFPVAILVGVGGPVLLGVIAAVALWRASSPAENQGIVRSGVRGVLRLGAVLMAFFVVARLVGAVTGGDDSDDDTDATVNVAIEELPLSLGDLSALGPIIRLQRATDTAAVRVAAAEFGEWLARHEGTTEAKQDLAREMIASLSGSARAAAERGLAPILGEPAVAAPADSIVIRYARALADGDTATVASLRDDATRALAGDEIERLERRAERLRGQNQELERDLEEERDSGGGLIAWVRGIADDLGIGFGWMAVYFTSFLALWEGQTLGKRMVGIRVIRLDLRPIGWWLAFERFGGYAASLSTGLLGFLQILWDRNRQGLHDKAVETVVVKEAEFRARMAARDQRGVRARA